MFVYFFASNTRVSISGSSEHKIVQDRRIRRYSNSSADHNSNLELVPVLIAASERSLYTNFRLLVIWIVITRIQIVSQLPRPGSLRFDMTREKIFMRGWRQSKRMKLFGAESCARQSHPLAWQVFQIRRPVELYFYYVRREQFGFHNIQYHVFGS